MPITLEQLEEKLLALPVENREKLAISLWDSLQPMDDGEEEFSPEYRAELDRRSAEIRNGTAVLIPYETVMRQIDEILSRG